MVVDDEPMLLSLLVAALRQVNCHILESISVSGAIEISSDPAQALDLVISDFQMPEMNGIQLAVRLRQQRPNVEFVFMTGNRDVFEDLTEQGFVCLNKPFPLDKLRDIVRSRLEHLTGS